MKNNVIDAKLLNSFKAGTTSEAGIQIRTKFKMSVQNAIDSLIALLEDEAWQLGSGEITELNNVVKRLVMIRDE